MPFIRKSLRTSSLVLAFGAALAGCSQSTTQSTRSVEPELSVSQREFECLREAIYFEARANSPQGQQAVANVIMNRASDPRFPGTICGVISEGEARGRCQFSFRCDGKAENFPDVIKFETATRAAERALADRSRDITNGAVYFHAASMRPGWFGTLDQQGNFGGNIFYRG